MGIWNRFLKNKFRTRLIVFFLMSIVLILATTLYTYYNSQMLITNTDNLFEKDIELNELYENIIAVEKSLELYLSTGTSESLTEYNRIASNLETWSTDVLSSPEYTQPGMIMKDIGNLILTYLSKANVAVTAKRGRNVSQFVKYYNESSITAGYLYREIDTLMVQQLQESAQYYSRISKRVNTLQVLNIVLIIAISSIIIVMIFVFSFKLTSPIDKLVLLSESIARGEFDMPVDIIDSKDEISVLSEAFRVMVPRLKNYVEGITEKAELEVQLKEEHMQNLTMKNALREAQLHALQTQINPHFIFNTINAGAQIALLEGDNKTSEFLVEAAVLFRYNLKSLDEPVSFSEEIANVRSYIYVLKARFRDTVGYHEEIDNDERLLNLKMPRLILQPVVENAYIHGLSELEDGGLISIKASIEGANAVIRIIDSGSGMSTKQQKWLIAHINGLKPELEMAEKKGGHTTGIGLTNIVKRLRLFSGVENVFEIESHPGSGTSVTFRLPLGN